jgi:LDH2 family malate/lactate/ureidoglycolate dehydrogenase
MPYLAQVENLIRFGTDVLETLGVPTSDAALLAESLVVAELWDRNGITTTNAKDAIHGLILPMAGHKGYIISFMMDVLSGVLTGTISVPKPEKPT